MDSKAAQARRRKALASEDYKRLVEFLKTRPPEAPTVKSLQDTMTVFASGMSRIGDLEAGAVTWGGMKTRGIGVDVGELSKPAVESLAKAVIDWQAKVFIDSGAFSMFKRNLRNLAAVEKELGDLFGDKEAKPKLQVS